VVAALVAVYVEGDDPDTRQGEYRYASVGGEAAIDQVPHLLDHTLEGEVSTLHNIPFVFDS